MSALLLEIKAGAGANLTKRERQIRNALREGRIGWEEIRIEDGRIVERKRLGAEE